MIGRGFSFAERARVVDGPLAPLAKSLAADLDRLLPDDDFFIPSEKARMTRRGGRCERDGAFLEFDPLSPRRHRCPACGTIFDADEHYRWWIMGYQLWLSERAVHAATLGRLVGGRYGSLAETIIGRLADRYATWPNADNVLGPTRVFFSTYLESIWLLQLSVAVSVLEAGAAAPVGDRFRERIADPSTALIAQFHEGLSNRQVWNSAALAATAVLLDRPDQFERAMYGSGGLQTFLDSGLLSDGSWYEGENYHLFAHRGLWYLVMLAQQQGAPLPDESARRFEAAFLTPLRTALPDYTFPARRDSQYRASLRQWRIAESLELGIARHPETTEIAGGLARLYKEGPAGDSARWRSTGEAERNVPGVRLTRADLGWKSLLFASRDLPDQPITASRSALMEGQGLGVIRRDEGRTFIALDYGHAGGSHGHPDRLNLWLVRGDDRVFEDVGTGSYVERTLHWYRSTLAHNAPLVDGESQDAVNGSLRAWHDGDRYGWVDAEAAIAQGVLVRRSVVAAPGYIVDRVAWESDRAITFDLPMHVEADIEGANWRRNQLGGGSGLEDGFEFVTDAQSAEGTSDPVQIQSGAISGATLVEGNHTWWKANAPGPPGEAARGFLLVRAQGTNGEILSVWSWLGTPTVGRVDADTIRVSIAGSDAMHRYSGDVWHVESENHDATLDGRRAPSHAGATTKPPGVRKILHIPRIRQPITAVGELSSGREGLRFHLAETQYRRTDRSWNESDAPEADVVIAATPTELLVEVTMHKIEATFAGQRDENPLDNEHPDTNSDGVQLHLAFPDESESSRYASWLLVPEATSGSVRTHSTGDATLVPLEASWTRTAGGWRILARIQRAPLSSGKVGIDVIVNEMPSSRERRRGQLVLSAAAPGWAYLRGDRQDIDQLIPMMLPHD